jgi:hypothetical protein
MLSSGTEKRQWAIRAGESSRVATRIARIGCPEPRSEYTDGIDTSSVKSVGSKRAAEECE